MKLIEPITITDAVLFSSNVPETDYAAWSSGTTYAVGARVILASTHKIYESTNGTGNTNKQPDQNLSTFWVEVGATNRWAMFDSQNNTQTSQAGSVTVDLKPVNLTGGVYVGNVDADSVTVTVTDPVEGVVYTSTASMLQSNSGSSAYNWFFKRIIRKTAAWFTDLPMYPNATITITLTRSTGNVKCGMCVIGAVLDIGMTETGVQTDIKDYSTRTFNPDGTSATVLRSYSKRMSVDVVVDNGEKDAIENQLVAYRQTPIVWIASTRFETTTVYGIYSSFKTVIDTFPKSRMSLQIEGIV
jgi:hypothetical protein